MCQRCYGPSGRVQIQAPITTNTNPCTASICQLRPSAKLIAKAAAMAIKDRRLAFGAMARWARQLWMAGPKLGCETSQLCSRGEDLAKQAAAKIMKGVVGTNGSTTPARPRARATRPRLIQSRRMGSGVSQTRAPVEGVGSSNRARHMAKPGLLRLAFSFPAPPPIGAYGGMPPRPLL